MIIRKDAVKTLRKMPVKIRNSEIETGRKKGSITTLQALGLALNVDLDDLIN